MNKPVILLSGITGFLGSHIAEYLSDTFLIIGLIRNTSNLRRLDEIKNSHILLVNLDDPDHKNQLHKYRPKVFIHSAWSGVGAGDRDDWQSQIQNVSYTYDLLELGKQVGITQFIGLGSQAEYGIFTGRIDETYICKPVNAYGASKLATLNIAQSFCTQYNITWYWLRIFPMFGTREALNWFIPSVIKTALQNGVMELTACEQRYGYLYVKDFCRAIEKLVISEPSPGVFNLASNSNIRLRNIVELIIEKTGTSGEFKFGALPYRQNQVMHMEGNSEKFFSTFDFYPSSNFEENIENVIKYYEQNLSSTPAAQRPN